MAQEERHTYGDIRLLDIECTEPQDWDVGDATHLRVSLPASRQTEQAMRSADFIWADRTLDVAINLSRSELDFGSLIRLQPVLTAERRDEVLEIAKESFPQDSRFHIGALPDQTIADRVLAEWVRALPEYYLCEYKDVAVGFLALCGEGDERFVYLAAVLERYRRAGAALSLYAAAARDCKASGVHMLKGRVSSANTAVMNLYTFLGGSFSNPLDVFLKEV